MNSLIKKLSTCDLSRDQLLPLLEPHLPKKHKNIALPWVELAKRLLTRAADEGSEVLLRNASTIVKMHLDGVVRRGLRNPNQFSQKYSDALNSLLTHLHFTMEDTNLPVMEMHNLSALILAAIIDMSVVAHKKGEESSVVSKIFMKLTLVFGHFQEQLLDALLHCRTLIHPSSRQPTVQVPLIKRLFSTLSCSKSMSPVLYLKYLLLGKLWLFMTEKKELGKTRTYIAKVLRVPEGVPEWAESRGVSWLALPQLNSRLILKNMTLTGALETFYGRRKDTSRDNDHLRKRKKKAPTASSVKNEPGPCKPSKNSKGRKAKTKNTSDAIKTKPSEALPTVSLSEMESDEDGDGKVKTENISDIYDTEANDKLFGASDLELESDEDVEGEVKIEDMSGTFNIETDDKLLSASVSELDSEEDVKQEPHALGVRNRMAGDGVLSCSERTKEKWKEQMKKKLEEALEQTGKKRKAQNNIEFNESCAELTQKRKKIKCKTDIEVADTGCMETKKITKVNNKEKLNKTKLKGLHTDCRKTKSKTKTEGNYSFKPSLAADFTSATEDATESNNFIHKAEEQSGELEQPHKLTSKKRLRDPTADQDSSRGKIRRQDQFAKVCGVSLEMVGQAEKKALPRLGKLLKRLQRIRKDSMTFTVTDLETERESSAKRELHDDSEELCVNENSAWEIVNNTVQTDSASGGVSRKKVTNVLSKTSSSSLNLKLNLDVATTSECSQLHHLSSDKQESSSEDSSDYDRSDDGEAKALSEDSAWGRKREESTSQENIDASEDHPEESSYSSNESSEEESDNEMVPTAENITVTMPEKESCVSLEEESDSSETDSDANSSSREEPEAVFGNDVPDGEEENDEVIDLENKSSATRVGVESDNFPGVLSKSDTITDISISSFSSVSEKRLKQTQNDHNTSESTSENKSASDNEITECRDTKPDRGEETTLDISSDKTVDLSTSGHNGSDECYVIGTEEGKVKQEISGHGRVDKAQDSRILSSSYTLAAPDSESEIEVVLDEVTSVTGPVHRLAVCGGDLQPCGRLKDEAVQREVERILKEDEEELRQLKEIKHASSITEKATDGPKSQSSKRRGDVAQDPVSKMMNNLYKSKVIENDSGGKGDGNTGVEVVKLLKTQLSNEAAVSLEGSVSHLNDPPLPTLEGEDDSESVEVMECEEEIESVLENIVRDTGRVTSIQGLRERLLSESSVQEELQGTTNHEEEKEDTETGESTNQEEDKEDPETRISTSQEEEEDKEIRETTNHEDKEDKEVRESTNHAEEKEDKEIRETTNNKEENEEDKEQREATNHEEEQEGKEMRDITNHEEEKEGKEMRDVTNHEEETEGEELRERTNHSKEKKDKELRKSTNHSEEEEDKETVEDNDSLPHDPQVTTYDSLNPPLNESLASTLYGGVKSEEPVDDEADSESLVRSIVKDKGRLAGIHELRERLLSKTPVKEEAVEETHQEADGDDKEVRECLSSTSESQDKIAEETYKDKQSEEMSGYEAVLSNIKCSPDKNFTDDIDIKDESLEEMSLSEETGNISDGRNDTGTSNTKQEELIGAGNCNDEEHVQSQRGVPPCTKLGPESKENHLLLSNGVEEIESSSPTTSGSGTTDKSGLDGLPTANDLTAGSSTLGDDASNTELNLVKEEVVEKVPVANGIPVGSMTLGGNGSNTELESAMEELGGKSLDGADEAYEASSDASEDSAPRTRRRSRPLRKSCAHQDPQRASDSDSSPVRAVCQRTSTLDTSGHQRLRRKRSQSCSLDNAIPGLEHNDRRQIIQSCGNKTFVMEKEHSFNKTFTIQARRISYSESSATSKAACDFLGEKGLVTPTKSNQDTSSTQSDVEASVEGRKPSAGVPQLHESESYLLPHVNQRRGSRDSDSQPIRCTTVNKTPTTDAAESSYTTSPGTQQNREMLDVLSLVDECMSPHSEKSTEPLDDTSSPCKAHVGDTDLAKESSAVEESTLRLRLSRTEEEPASPESDVPFNEHSSPSENSEMDTETQKSSPLSDGERQKSLSEVNKIENGESCTRAQRLQKCDTHSHAEVENGNKHQDTSKENDQTENNNEVNEEITEEFFEGEEMEVLSTSGIEEEDEEEAVRATPEALDDEDYDNDGAAEAKKLDLLISKKSLRSHIRQLYLSKDGKEVNSEAGNRDRKLAQIPLVKAQCLSEVALTKEVLISPDVSDEECELVSPGVDLHGVKYPVEEDGIEGTFRHKNATSLRFPSHSLQKSGGGINSPHKTIPEEQDESTVPGNTDRNSLRSSSLIKLKSSNNSPSLSIQTTPHKIIPEEQDESAVSRNAIENLPKTSSVKKGKSCSTSPLSTQITPHKTITEEQDESSLPRNMKEELHKTSSAKKGKSSNSTSPSLPSQATPHKTIPEEQDESTLPRDTERNLPRTSSVKKGRSSSNISPSLSAQTTPHKTTPEEDKSTEPRTTSEDVHKISSVKKGRSSITPPSFPTMEKIPERRIYTRRSSRGMLGDGPPGSPQSSETLRSTKNHTKTPKASSSTTQEEGSVTLGHDHVLDASSKPSDAVHCRKQKDSVGDSGEDSGSILGKNDKGNRVKGLQSDPPSSPSLPRKEPSARRSASHERFPADTQNQNNEFSSEDTSDTDHPAKYKHAKSQITRSSLNSTSKEEHEDKKGRKNRLSSLSEEEDVSGSNMSRLSAVRTFRGRSSSLSSSSSYPLTPIRRSSRLKKHASGSSSLTKDTRNQDSGSVSSESEMETVDTEDKREAPSTPTGYRRSTRTAATLRKTHSKGDS